MNKSPMPKWRLARRLAAGLEHEFLLDRLPDLQEWQRVEEYTSAFPSAYWDRQRAIDLLHALLPDQ